MSTRPPHTLAQLRSFAVAHTLFEPGPLSGAMQRLGFVQADPIRAPARAQDLILRHRVRDYRAGDLERSYPAHALEEGYLYAYGFLNQAAWPLVHRHNGPGLSAHEAAVLKVMKASGPVLPRALEAHFGAQVRSNAWGGQSRAINMTLDHLLHRGLLRVSHREGGHRLFAPVEPVAVPDPAARLEQLILLCAQVLAPVRVKTLRAIVQRLTRHIPGRPDARRGIERACQQGLLEAARIDAQEYLWPAGALPVDAPKPGVRFLAPFDPLVWDRERFEHLWGWAYRFEAYVPAAKRVRGYYALPLLLGREVIGWVNLKVQDGFLSVEPGYDKPPPQTKAFARHFEAEVARTARFLGLRARDKTT